MITIYVEQGALSALPTAIGGCVQAYIHRFSGTGRVEFAPVAPVQAEPSDERAAFELWAIAEGFNTTRDSSDKYREYHKTTTRWAWMAWQACSRWASIQGARQ